MTILQICLGSGNVSRKLEAIDTVSSTKKSDSGDRVDESNEKKGNFSPKEPKKIVSQFVGCAHRVRSDTGGFFDWGYVKAAAIWSLLANIGRV